MEEPSDGGLQPILVVGVPTPGPSLFQATVLQQGLEMERRLAGLLELLLRGSHISAFHLYAGHRRPTGSIHVLQIL